MGARGDHREHAFVGGALNVFRLERGVLCSGQRLGGVVNDWGAMHIDTERLLLREFVEADAEVTNVYEREAEVVRFQSFAPRTLAQSLEYIQRSMASARERPRRVFDLAVVSRRDGGLIGRCGLGVRDPEQGEAALWYILHPAHWGMGYAPEACTALLRFGFETLGLHRVIIDTEPENRASIRVAEKLGMRREAHFVENYWSKGRWTDSVIFALLKREWE